VRIETNRRRLAPPPVIAWLVRETLLKDLQRAVAQASEAGLSVSALETGQSSVRAGASSGCSAEASAPYVLELPAAPSSGAGDSEN